MTSREQPPCSRLLFAITYDLDHRTAAFTICAHANTPIPPTPDDDQRITRFADALIQILAKYLHPSAPNPVLVKTPKTPTSN
jgi:hypothetical protein